MKRFQEHIHNVYKKEKNFPLKNEFNFLIINLKNFTQFSITVKIEISHINLYRRKLEKFYNFIKSQKKCRYNN